MIRSLLLSSVASLALATSALAADLPNVKGPPVFTPPPPPVFSWSGVYIGGQVGYEWGDTRADAFSTATGGFVDSADHRDEGVVGGAHVGYNWQFSQFVFGLEGDVNGSSYDGTGGFFGPGFPDTDRTRIPVDGSVRGRLGIAFDRVLVYGTGGVAFGSIRNSVFDPTTGFFDQDQTGRVGWTVGGGIEYAIDNNWSIRAEYRYTDYGTFSYPLLNTSVPPGAIGVRVRETDSRATVGFSYKFDMFAPPAPVVAKY